MKKILFFITILIPVLFISCDKEMEEPEPVPPTNYHPATKGSYWTYAGYEGGLTYNMEISGIDSMINGNKYISFNHSLYGLGWYRKNEGSYYHLFNLNGELVEFLFLKHDQPVGYSWTMEYVLAGVPTRMVYTILGTEEKKTVFGRLYNDVITVKVDTYIDTGGGYGSVYITGTYQYANDVGFIYSDVSGEGKTYLEFFNIKQ